MAKQGKTPLPLATEEERGPVDLLQMDVDGVEPEAKTYTVEVGEDAVELTLDQLLELARRCLELQIGGTQRQNVGDDALRDVPELLEFVQNYPDVREFPPAVEEQIKQGKHPLDAYRTYENAQLRSQLRAFEQNEANKQKSLGSARGEAGADEELDALMAIYHSVFK